MQVRFIHAVARVNGSFLFIVENCSIIGMCNDLFIHSPAEGQGSHSEQLTCREKVETVCNRADSQLGSLQDCGKFQRVDISSKLPLVQLKEGNGSLACFLENRIPILWPTLAT